jgi:hypothetical protein
MECEIQRKKESSKRATVFDQARGFQRQNWKSKSFNPLDDPTQNIESSEESDYGDELNFNKKQENPEDN